eukprot:373473_1
MTVRPQEELFLTAAIQHCTLSFLSLHDIINVMCMNNGCNIEIKAKFKIISQLKLSDLMQVRAIKTANIPYKSTDSSDKSKRYSLCSANEDPPDIIPQYKIQSRIFEGVSILNKIKVCQLIMDFSDAFIVLDCISEKHFAIASKQSNIYQKKSVKLISSKWLFSNINNIEKYVICDGNEWDLTFWDPPVFRFFLRGIVSPSDKPLCKIKSIHLSKKSGAFFWTKGCFNFIDINVLTSLELDYLHVNEWVLESLSKLTNLKELIVNNYATDADGNYLWCHFDPEGCLSYIGHFFAPYKYNRNGVVDWLKQKLCLLKNLKHIVWKGEILEDKNRLCDQLMVIVDGVHENQEWKNKYHDPYP